MKIILRKDHEKLGAIGSLVDVKDGYARNYLIPRGIAYVATEGNMRALEAEKKAASARTDKEKRLSEKTAVELERALGHHLDEGGRGRKALRLRDGPEDRRFPEGERDRSRQRVIALEEPIKALGIYDVDVKLPHGVQGKVKVWVVRE